jgi:hypothetical protein
MGDSLLPGRKFRVKGIYRCPRKGEFFWAWALGHMSEAMFNFVDAPLVILEEVTP